MDKLTQSSTQYPQPTGLAVANNQGEIPKKLDILDMNVNVINQVLQQLEDKLYPVLEQNDDKELGDPLPSASTSFGTQLDASNQGLQYGIRRINSIISRLHV